MDIALWREYLGQMDRLGETLEQLTAVEREKPPPWARATWPPWTPA